MYRCKFFQIANYFYFVVESREKSNTKLPPSLHSVSTTKQDSFRILFLMANLTRLISGTKRRSSKALSLLKM